VKKQYFFGYLFVRAAKPLALLVILIGIGFCVLQYSQANAAASAIAYQPSASLQRALNKLKDAFFATEHIISALNTDNELRTPKVQIPQFPPAVGSNADFAHVANILSKVDQDRQQLKESILGRFETAVQSIEAKLREYAAKLKSLSPAAPSAASTPAPSATPPTVAPQPQESLFSSKLSPADVTKRSTNLSLRKEFLKVLETKAENPQNRAKLSDAVNQLDSFIRLLPEKLDSGGGQVELASGQSDDAGTDQNPKLLPSERVAGELEQLRGEVRQTLLTSWTVDETFEQAAELTSVEREKCRIATLAQKGIWLSAVSRILMGLLAAILVSSVILVCADLVRTLLDTAAHTGVLADAINALRGSIVTSRRQAREAEAVGDSR
jgi:hypothetical protein